MQTRIVEYGIAESKLVEQFAVGAQEAIEKPETWAEAQNLADALALYEWVAEERKGKEARFYKDAVLRGLRTLEEWAEDDDTDRAVAKTLRTKIEAEMAGRKVEEPSDIGGGKAVGCEHCDRAFATAEEANEHEAKAHNVCLVEICSCDWKEQFPTEQVQEAGKAGLPFVHTPTEVLSDEVVVIVSNHQLDQETVDRLYGKTERWLDEGTENERQEWNGEKTRLEDLIGFEHTTE